MSQDFPINTFERKLRAVRYVHHPGPWHEPEPAENSLLVFIYDIPHFGACGVFSPFRLLNQFLLQGGSEGGMSPGATWEPFALSSTEYADLVDAVRNIPPESLRDRARYAHVAFIFDSDFDGAPDTYPVHPETKVWHRHIPPDHREYFQWSSAVCAKHRDHWHAEVKRVGFMS